MTYPSQINKTAIVVARVVAWLVCVAFVPAALQAAPAPSAPGGDELIENGSPRQDWPDAWTRGGDPAHARIVRTPANAKKPDGFCFEFSAPNAKAEQRVPLDPAWWKLELRFRMKTEQVVRGKADWQNARMALRFVDATWQTIPPYPHNVGLSGTNDWSDHKVELTVPEGAAYLVVEPAMFGESGTVWFADISLRVRSLHPVKADAADPLGAGADLWALKNAWKADSATRQRVSLNGYWRFFPVFDQPVEDGATADRLPAPGGGWGFFKVPGFWSRENRGEQPVVLSPWIEKKLAEAGVSREAFRRAWYQRRIDVPDTWSGRRIVLRLEDVQGEARVFVGGRAAGVIGWPGGELDLTGWCAPGRSHELSLLVSDRVPADNQLAPLTHLDAIAAGNPQSGGNRGLCGDAWLTAEPDPARTGLRLGSVLVQTSVREGRIAFRTPLVTAEARSPALADLFLRAEIFDAEGRRVKTVESLPGVLRDAEPDAEAAARNERVLTWGGEWTPGADDGPKLWDLETPHLYTARVALIRRGGEIVDETLPVRFGFREFWMDGRDMRLNGRRVTLRALQVRNNMHPSSYLAGMDSCRDTIANIKDVGGNFATLHNYRVEPGRTGYGGNLYTAADEMGLMLSLTLPHAASYKWELDKPEVRAAYARLTRWMIELHGNHPSIVLYATSHNTLAYADLNPLKIDGKYTPVDDSVTYMDQKDTKDLAGRRWQAFNVVEPIVGGFDPTRAVYHHSAGNAGAMLTHNDYLNWSPPQERAEWHAHWAAEGVKPVFIVEYGLPHTASFTSFRGPGFIYRPEVALLPKWWLDSEYGAAFFNQEAYRMTPGKAEERRAHLQRLQNRGQPAGWGKVKTDATFYDVLALHMRHYLPAFRTWGVSWQLWDMEELWKTDRQAPRLWHAGDLEKGASVADVSRPGIRPDFHGLAWQRVYDRPGGSFWVETSATREMRRWSHPVIGFIAGGDTDIAGFTERARNFEAGQTVRKQLIVINESARETECRYEWTLEGTDEAGRGAVAVAAGAQVRIPVKALLPQTRAGGRHRLAARFEFSNAEPQTDEFVVNLLPSAAAGPHNAGAAALLDSSGDSSRTLTRLGIAHRRYASAAELPAADALARDGTLLIIGRGALDAGVRIPHLEAVGRGLNVLVFEQSEETLRKVGGFRTQTLRVRNVFGRAPGHPALRGLGDELLADWQGGSSLIPEYDTAREFGTGEPKDEWCGFRNSRVWRGSNRGAVATVLIEKPSVGDFLPLVDGGFDLQYSPLIEWRPASRDARSGRMILCQLDVTERSRPDPAADRLVLNLVGYMRNGPKTAPRGLVYAGDRQGGSLLESLGFAAKAYDGRLAAADSVLVIGPGAPVIRNLDTLVKQGLHVLAVGLSKDELSRQWPGRFADVEERELVPSLMDADALGAPEFAGISNAETHWWVFPNLSALPASPDAKGNEALQRIASGRGVIVFSQAAPWMFADETKPWERTTWRRSAYLVSRLLHNLGADARRTGSLETLLASGDATRPQPWLGTHYLQVPARSDDPYIYYRW